MKITAAFLQPAPRLSLRGSCVLFRAAAVPLTYTSSMVFSMLIAAMPLCRNRVAFRPLRSASEYVQERIRTSYFKECSHYM